MARWACAEIPALPLQLLLRGHSGWRGHPAVVVPQDLPQSPVLWANERARQAGVVPGLSYASALTLASGLRAGVVPDAEVARAIDEVTEALRRFSPHVEPARDEPGVLWLDASGLERLHASLTEWAQSIRDALGRLGYDAVIVVGFSRFGTYAAARITRGIRVLVDPDEEQTLGRQVSLRRLYLPPETLDALGRLGVTTIEDLLRLPAGGLLERFGPIVEHLHRMASGDLWIPLQPVPAADPVRRHVVLDTPESDAQRLLFIVKQIVDPLLTMLALRGHALTALDLRLRMGTGAWSSQVIRPAAPTLDAVRVADLVRLRLETTRVDQGVVEVVVDAAGAPATPEQLAVLPAAGPARDLESGTRALDRLRARYGDDAVTCGTLREGHLPEARFGWEPVTRLRMAQPRLVEKRVLVRRIFKRPLPLDGDTPPIAGAPPAVAGRGQAAGPYIVSGGWWIRETHRAYYFMEGRGGELWWVFYDGVRRRWYLHGRVE